MSARFTEETAPDTPVSGKVVVYAKADGLMYSKDDAGVETLMSNLASAAITALTGDVTATGPGSVAATIAADAVSNAKLSNVATSTFKGRTTAGTGDPEDLTVSQAKALLSLSGSNTGDQTITLTGDVTGTGVGSFAATIANDAVTYAKIQNATTNKLLGRATAGSGDLEEITLGTNLSFSGTTLNASDTDTGITQLTGDVTAGPGNGSQASTITNDAVTNAKLANMATQTFKGRATAGTGDPEDLTVAQVKSILNIVSLDIVSYSYFGGL